MTSSEIRGYQDWRAFSVPTADVVKLEATRSPKVGYALFAYVCSSNHGIELPLVEGARKEAYKQALRSVCPSDQTKLDW